MKPFGEGTSASVLSSLHGYSTWILVTFVLTRVPTERVCVLVDDTVFVVGRESVTCVLIVEGCLLYTGPCLTATPSGWELILVRH